MKRLWLPCAEALARLAPGERLRAIARLRAVRDGFPSVAEMFRIEFISQELMAFGKTMQPGAGGRLVPGARAQLAAGDPLPWWEQVVARDGWRAMRATWDKLLRVAELNHGLARDAGFAAVVKETERRVNPFVSIGMAGAQAKYARRAEAAVARMDLIVLSAAAAGFREREGRWPATIGELSGSGLLTQGEAARLAEASLASSGPVGPLELRLVVTTGDEKEPREPLSLIVRPPAPARPAPGR